LLSLAVFALIAPPFGWGARSDPASQIRASYHELFSALKANNVTRVCSHTNDPRKCRWQFAVAKAFIRSGKVADLYAAGEFRAISNDVDTWPSRLGRRRTRNGSGNLWRSRGLHRAYRDMGQDPGRVEAGRVASRASSLLAW